MLNETSIRCFLTLARTLSFTETARRTYMTQQSVSKYIAKLEEELGFPLFIRTHHYVLLTRAGENYYRLFQELEENFQRTSEETRRFYQEKRGVLQVGCLEWLDLQRPVQAALEKLRREQPELRSRVERHSLNELNRGLLEQSLDVILSFDSLTPKGNGLERLTLLETPLLLLASPQNPRAKPDAALTDFRGACFLRASAFRESPAETRARARRQLRELGLSPGEIVSAPNVESAYLAVKFGQGVLVSTELTRRSLGAELFSLPLGKTEPLVCCWRSKTENPAVERFVEALMRSFKYEVGEEV